MPQSTDNEAVCADPELVREELAGVLFQNVPIVIVGNLLVGTLTTLVLFPYVDPWLLLMWGGVFLASLVMRAAVYLGYRRHAAGHGRGVRWARRYTLAAFLGGVAWALMPLLFLDLDVPITFSSITMLVAGMCAGAVGLYAGWPPAYAAFGTPFVLAFAASVVARGESDLLLGALVLVGHGSFIGLCAVSNVRLRHSILIQFRNRDLVERLGVAKQRAEEANAVKSQLFAAISHDLRQPLQSMRLYTDLLRQKSASPQTLDLHHKLEHSMTALTGMLEQLLDMSRMDAHSVEVTMQCVDLEQLAERVYSQFVPVADQKGIELEVDCPGLWAWADAVLLGRVLDNLVSNALRYTEQGDVCVVSSRVGDTVEIDVIDTGPGIPAEERERVFQEFYQLHNESRQRTEGLGIGLAIVQRLCALMDVRIDLMATERGGTRVRLRLRAAEPEPLSA